ncbi:MAG TPA: DNA glycosylase, partial [Bacillota bacterium]|nr:DNA glycosylase [Bacillota bacterium]
GYTGIVGDKVCRVISRPDRLILENCTEKDFDAIWRYYFDFDRDYESIKEQLSKDSILREAITYGWGIHILNQDPWETLISFIISANNNIGRIKNIIERLSHRLGKPVSYEGRDYYTFPEPEALAWLDDEVLKQCGCGYRGPYIKETARMVAEGEIDPLALRQIPYLKARQELLKCKGVGEKVADCISLFSLGKIQAFPVDVWIKRIMEEFYLHGEAPVKKIRAIAEQKFGKYAGLAQQYLFFYARDKKIGR